MLLQRYKLVKCYIFPMVNLWYSLYSYVHVLFVLITQVSDQLTCTCMLLHVKRIYSFPFNIRVLHEC